LSLLGSLDGLPAEGFGRADGDAGGARPGVKVESVNMNVPTGLEGG
jgi:hypothetical protein